MHGEKERDRGPRFVKTFLADQAYDEIKRQILDQRLRPGMRLNIDALSRECGISSSPLREALVRLGAEGLVVFAANSGFSVAPVPDARQMEQMLEFRLLMEAHCARVGAQRGDEASLAAMKRAVETMAALRAKGAPQKQLRAYLDTEQAFHQALVDSAVSAAYQELPLILSVARQSVVPKSNTVGSDDAVREHPEIIAAFEAHDPDRAESAVRGHLGAAQRRMNDRKTPNYGHSGGAHCAAPRHRMQLQACLASRR